jgi:hypothetical protein
LLHRLDSTDLEQDIRALDVIQNVGALPIRPEFESGEVFRSAQDWIEANRPDLGPPHVATRERVAAFLEGSGVSRTAIEDAKGLTGSNNDFRLIQLPGQQQWLVDPVLDITSLSVDEAVERFESLAMSQTVTIATDVAIGKESDLSDQLQTCPAGIQLVQLAGQAIALHFEEVPQLGQLPEILPPPEDLPFYPGIESATPPPLPGELFGAVPQTLDVSQSQQSELKCSFVEYLAATTTQTQIPSIYQLLYPAGRDPAIHDLQADTELLDRLRAVYGTVKLSLAQQIAAEDYAQAYKSIDIFGFSLSTRRFPWAILVLTMLTVMAIAWTVESARRLRRPVIGGDEDVVDIALDTPFLRAVIWIALPLLSILASLTLYPFAGAELAVLVAGGLLTVGLAVVATLRARGL